MKAAPLPAEQTGSGAAVKGVLAALMMFMLLAPAAPGRADPVAEKKQAAEQLDRRRQELQSGQARDKALAARRDALRRELHDLQKQAVALAAGVREARAKIARNSERLEDLRILEADTRRRLLADRQRQGRTLAALIRLSRRPPVALLAAPGDSRDILHAATLLRALPPVLQRRAGEIRQTLEAIVSLRRETEALRRELDALRQRLDKERRQLERAMAARKVASAHLAVAARRQQQRNRALAREVKNLSALLARLDAARAAKARERKRKLRESRTVSFASLRGRMPIPVRGRILRRFGTPDPAGLKTRGVEIATAPDAVIVAPARGEVVFAGPFRKLGLLLIMDMGGGYHILLSGMARIEVGLGQTVLAGEPVGVMASGAVPPPRLYVELRKNGEPVNPLPWFVTGKGKVSG